MSSYSTSAALMEAQDEMDPSIPAVLPHDKVYLIQVGYKLFRLSGASLLLDAPSYFTSFFQEKTNEEKILFIDRNPTVFEKIYNHLQGYHISIENEYDFTHLWVDCYYFGLRRLQKLLQAEDAFATVGGKLFKIPKLLLMQSGNHPNFFSINEESVLTDKRRIIVKLGMIRPPPQRPALAPNRLPQLFADLLEVLRGNTLAVRDDEHRALLVRECRYYRFLELEQRIVKHRIVPNLFLGTPEIVLRLGDIVARGVINVSGGVDDERPAQYARPYLAREPHRSLIVQVDAVPGSEVKLVLNRNSRMSFIVCTNKIATQMSHSFKHLSPDFSEMLKDNRLHMLVGLRDSKAVINSMELKPGWFLDFWLDEEPEPKKRKRDHMDELVEFQLSKSLWRVMFRMNKPRLHAVALEGLSEQTFFDRSITYL